MRRLVPSMQVRDELIRLLAGSTEPETNVVSVFLELAVGLVAKQLLEPEQADFLGGRGRYERRGEGQRGSRNGYEPGRIRSAEGAIPVAVPQVRGTDQPFRFRFDGLSGGHTRGPQNTSLRRCMQKGLSVRDLQDAFRDATGELLILRSAVFKRSPTPSFEDS